MTLGRPSNASTPETNPWVRASGQRDQAAAPAPHEAAPAVRPSLAPQAGVEAPDAGLPRRPLRPGEHARWIVVGAHGGAGETTIADLIAGGRAAGHAWPIATEDDPPNVLLVARTTHRGLHAAQSALREWASGVVPVQLAGLVLIADAPGRMPKHLRQQAGVLGKAAPECWRIPWIAAWRDGNLDPGALPASVRELLSALVSFEPSTPHSRST